MKIQTTVQINELIEIDIEFPYYCKAEDAYFYVISEDKAIRVSNYNGCECVMVSSPKHSHTARQIGNAIACTKNDYDIAFQHALRAINAFEITKPNPENFTIRGEHDTLDFDGASYYEELEQFNENRREAI